MDVKFQSKSELRGSKFRKMATWISELRITLMQPRVN